MKNIQGYIKVGVKQVNLNLVYISSILPINAIVLHFFAHLQL